MPLPYSTYVRNIEKEYERLPVKKKKERKWIILKFPWSSTCAQSAEE